MQIPLGHYTTKPSLSVVATVMPLAVMLVVEVDEDEDDVEEVDDDEYDKDVDGSANTYDDD